MATGAGVEAAREFGGREIIDPRPFARGTIAEMYARYPHLGPILPALGYYPDQLRDLEATVAAVPADVVVSATPFTLERLIQVDKPVVRVGYEMAERGEPRLSDFVREFVARRVMKG
jgi:predicted GTPase